MRRHERHHLPTHLQGRHVPFQIDPIQALDIQRHMTIEKIVHRRHPSHNHQPDRIRQGRPAPDLAVRGEASLATST